LQQWIANRIELESIIEQMKMVSQDAFEAASLLLHEDEQTTHSRKNPENNYPSKAVFRARNVGNSIILVRNPEEKCPSFLGPVGFSCLGSMQPYIRANCPL